MTTIFRVRFKIAGWSHGQHVHCCLFCAEGPDRTFAKCGDFVVRKGNEFRDLLGAFSKAEFIGDDESIGISEAVSDTRISSNEQSR